MYTFTSQSPLLKKVFYARTFLTILLAIGFADLVLNNQVVHAQSIDISSDGITTGISGLTDNGTLVTIDPTVTIDLNPSVIIGYLNAGKSVTLKSADNITVESWTDIIVNPPSPVTLRFESEGLLPSQILFNWTVEVKSTGSPMNVEMIMRTASNVRSATAVLNNIDVNTNGGDFTINNVVSYSTEGLSIGNASGGATINTGAGDISISGDANSASISTGVVYITNSSLSTSSGDITVSGLVRGSNSSGANAVLIDANSTIQTGTGNVSISGVRTTTTTNGTYVTRIFDRASITSGGTLSISGSRDDSGRGVYLNAVLQSAGDFTVTGTTINFTSILVDGGSLTSTAGNILLTGNLRIGLESANASIIASGGGDITLNSNSILLSNSRVLTLNTTGNISIVPNTTSFGQALTLSSTAINIASTPSSVTVGNTTNTAVINVNSAQNVNGPISLYGGAIAVNANITATGGNILLDAELGSGVATNLDGINVADNITIQTVTSGDITMIGRSTSGAVDDKSGFRAAANTVVSAAGALSITGTCESSSETLSRGINLIGTFSAVGDVTIRGNDNVATAKDGLVFGGASVSSTGGSISLHTDGSSSIYGFGTNTLTASNNISLNSNRIYFSSVSVDFDADGVVNILAADGSTSFEVGFTLGSGISLDPGITGLTIGNTGNTKLVTIDVPIAIAGPISVYGGAIAVNENVIATGGNILLDADVGSNIATAADGINVAEGVTIQTNTTGDITLIGRSGNDATINLMGVEVNNAASPVNNTNIVSAGALNITGISVATVSGATRGVTLGKGNYTAVGDITVTGTGSPTNLGDVILSDATLTSSTGSIKLYGTNNEGSFYTYGTNVLNAEVDINLFLNKIYLTANTIAFNAKNDVSFLSKVGLSTFGLGIVFDSGITFGPNLQSLTIGNTTNDQLITINTPLSIGGPISIYGGSIDVNANITATGGDILLDADLGSTIAGGTLDGILIDNAITISTVTSGNITLLGRSGDNAGVITGVNMTNTAITTINSAGDIAITGRSFATSSSGGRGVNMINDVLTAAGSITIIGQHDDQSSFGVALSNTDVTAGTGITLRALDELSDDKGTVIPSDGTTLNGGSGPVALIGQRVYFSGTATSITTSDEVSILSENASFADAINTGLVTISSTATGLTIGKSTNTADVTIGAATTIAGPITIYGGMVNVDANLSSTATTGNGITIQGQRILQDNGIDATTSGADISYTAANFVSTTASERLIELKGSGADRAIVNANGGSISIAGSYGGGGTAGTSAERAIGFEIADLITNGTGSISLTGDATNSGNTTQSAWAMQPNDARIITDAGDITLTMTGGAATTNSRGIGAAGTFSVLSASGTITIRDLQPAGLTGTYQGLYLQPSSANAIVFGADGSTVATSSSDIIIEADKATFATQTTRINTSGAVTIRPEGASFAATLNNSLINIENTATALTLGKAGNTGDITVARAATIAGPITIYGGSLAINASLNTASGGAAGDILLKASGDIALSGNQSITSNGGDMIFWSDADASNAGDIFFDSPTGDFSNPVVISTGGGHLWMGGGSGSTTWNGLTVGDGFAIGGTARSVSGGTQYTGIVFEGTRITTATGNIQLKGRSSSATITPNNTEYAGGIWMGGNATNQGFINSGGGDIDMQMYAQGGTGPKWGFYNFGNFSISAGAGNISILGDASVAVGDNYNGAGNGVFLNANNPITADGNISITGYEGTGNNIVGVDIRSAITSTAGDITIIGDDLSFGAAVSAATGALNLTASGAVTQSAALTANGLGLHGAGTFTLTNTSNNVSTIAGGDNINKLGSINFVDASGGLTIGTVNPTGIYSTGPILIETLSGDITLSESLTTDNTSADAIIVNAGKSAAIGTATGGNIIVPGTPTITMGSGGIAKLYSGFEQGSVGLTGLAGGSSNTRTGFDETSTITPALSANNIYAIYRSAATLSDVTIVATGGDVVNTNWSYSNGVITVLANASLNASDVVSYLASGALTIEAANITIASGANIISNASNALTLNANSNIVIGAALTITNANTILQAGSNVTQTSPIITNSLALTGTGTFTLDHVNNEISILAGGSSSTRLGAVTVKSRTPLTIGSVNPDGIYSTGLIFISTINGADINLNQAVNTTSTDANAIRIFADLGVAAGTAAGGQILVNGGSVTTGTGGYAKLYSGNENSSIGLNTLISSSTFRKYNFDTDENTDNNVLGILSTPGYYAVYRDTEYKLDNLTVGSGTLAPAFNSAIKAYTVTFGTAQGTFSFTPTVNSGQIHISKENGAFASHTNATAYTDNSPDAVSTKYIIQIRNGSDIKTTYTLHLLTNVASVPTAILREADWQPLFAGATFDPNDDQQATAETDLVGNGNDPMLMSQLRTLSINDTVQKVYYFRVRLGNTGTPKTAGYFGLDVDKDLNIDMVVQADLKAKNPYVSYHIADPRKDGSGPSQTSWLNSATDRDIERRLPNTKSTIVNYPVSTTASAQGSNGVTAPDLDNPVGGQNTGTDTWLEFGFAEISFQSFTLDALGTARSGADVNGIVYFTSTSQTANGDIGGINDQTADLNKTWAELGIIYESSLEAATSDELDPPVVVVVSTESLNGGGTIYGTWNGTQICSTATLSLTLNGITYTSPSQIQLTAPGGWNLPFTGLNPGTYPVTVTITDPCSGQTGQATASVFIASVLVTPLLTTSTQPTLTGTSNTSSATITVEVFNALDQSQFTETVTSDANGNWSLDVSSIIPTAPTLAIGTYRVNASVTIGNNTSSANGTLRVVNEIVGFGDIFIATTGGEASGAGIWNFNAARGAIVPEKASVRISMADLDAHFVNNALTIEAANITFEDPYSKPSGKLELKVVGDGGEARGRIAIDANVEVEELTLDGYTEVASGKYVELTGNLSTSDTLKLKHGINGYSQLLFDGSYSGSNLITLEQQITGTGWHNLSNPFENQTASSFGVVGTDRHTNAENLRQWNPEAAYVWENISSGTAALDPGRGYIGYFGDNPLGYQSGLQVGTGPWTLSITGKPMTTVSPVLYYNEKKDGTWQGYDDPSSPHGWNFVGNPFTSILDFNALTLPNHVNNAFYIWDPNKVGGAGYVSWSGAGITDPYIAPLQAFWVQTTSDFLNNGTTLPINMATHGTVVSSGNRPGFFKTAGADFDRVVLRVKPSAAQEWADHTVIALVEGTDNGYDADWDAYKWLSPGTTPNLYSVYGQSRLANNAVSYSWTSTGYKSIPVGFSSTEAGNYSISLDDNWLLRSYYLTLEDRVTGKLHDLVNAGAYGFTHDSSITNRFILHIGNNPIALSAPSAALDAGYWADAIHISSLRYDGMLSCTLVDITGREILHRDNLEIVSGGTIEIQLAQRPAPGTYVLHVVAGEQTYAVKVTL